MAIAAIQTSYAGYRFRSRLEARWAVFFDVLKIKWEYEPQGYLVGRSDNQKSYLPDFYLSDLELWVEVKGQATERDFDVLQLAALAETDGGLPGNGNYDTVNVLVLGNIPQAGTTMALHLGFGYNHRNVAVNPLVAWIPSKQYGAFPWTIVRWLPWRAKPEDLTRPMSLEVGSGYQPIWDAYAAARTARFEHGESGAPQSIRTW